MFDETPVADRLDEIDCSTLVIVGENDHETPLAYAEELTAGIPDSRLVVLDGVGHLVASEAPDRFNQVVRAFFDDP